MAFRENDRIVTLLKSLAHVTVDAHVLAKTGIGLILDGASFRANLKGDEKKFAFGLLQMWRNVARLCRSDRPNGEGCATFWSP